MPSASPEKAELTLGFIPLTDCAPLVVAHERGLFARHGLTVTLSREASWATIRDKVALDSLDGAHMLATMPLAASVGAGMVNRPMVTSLSLGLGGNAITVSNALHQRMLDAEPAAASDPAATAGALKQVVEADRAAGRSPLTFAHVFPASTHNFQLRYWLASGGIDPDRDVQLTVVPPPQMVAALNAGQIAGYCVGEPWNARAREMGLGRSVIASYELWNNHPEKVLGVSRDWAESHPATHRALVMALLEAGQWLDRPANRSEAARLLARPEYVDAPVSAIEGALMGRFGAPGGERGIPDFHVFHRYAAGFPWRSHGEWYLRQMVRWGYLSPDHDCSSAAAEVYRPEPFRDAARTLGLAAPTVDRKSEGRHAGPWTLAGFPAAIAMGPDRFLDGAVFEPEGQADPLPMG
ncbi:MAG: CmpA/NrtA family ABC transporter substrate-binding protein [Thiohalorhabdaceae bacterium]